MVGKNNAVKSHREPPTRDSLPKNVQASHLRHLPGELLREVGYPDDVIDVFLESSRGPTVLTDPKEFLEASPTHSKYGGAEPCGCDAQACLYESHVDNCIVLKDGMRKLGLHRTSPTIRL